MLPSNPREESPELVLCEGQSTHEGSLLDYESNSLQYCDACNASCVMMSGRRRKLQVRYEGYVLVKRVPSGTSFALATHHYDGNILQRAPQVLFDEGVDQKCHVSDDLPYEKMIGMSPEKPWCKINDEYRSRIKLVNLFTEANTTPTLSSSLPIKPSPTKKEKKSSRNHHQMLCRKKSKSQENLSCDRVRASTNGVGIDTSGGNSVVLNNTIQPPPLTSSLLSKSEGSIHNVHKIHPEEVAGGEKIMSSAVTDLARVKRMLSRFTDEFGQIVFDLEGWNEYYVTLTDSSVEFKNTLVDTKSLLSVPYASLVDVSVVRPSGGRNSKYCIRMLTQDVAILLQTNTSYTRDQWLHSIQWKKNASKFRNLLRSARSPEVLLKELKNLVDVSLAAPLHDPSVCQLPLDLASSILTSSDAWLSQHMSEEVIVTLAPLLENNTPSPQICNFFSKHCRAAPRSTLVIDMFTPVVKRILKHNVDFGKYPHVLKFVQNYIQALNSQNDGENVVLNFVRILHGKSSTCPHVRILPNLVSVCIAAVNLFENNKAIDVNIMDSNDKHMTCYLCILNLICEYDDWRPGLAALMQPVPFPESFLSDSNLVRRIVPVIRSIGSDHRCEVHQMIAAPSREKKDGWLQLLCPSSVACVDEGVAWASVISTLINCCCRRKKFLATQIDSLGAFMFLALRGDETAHEVLCLMLEWHLIENSDLRVQVATTLQSTVSGKTFYQDLCDRQLHLRELQQKGGPRKLTLPSRSTDEDVIRLLSSGSFGNLQVLSLAFTRVTSECAHQLIKLPDLRYLNLWATQFGDKGLLLITEHLHKLQVLNLCETQVTDLGLATVTSLKNLRKLNMNSTSLSMEIFNDIKSSLPALQEVDVKYTEAWWPNT